MHVHTHMLLKYTIILRGGVNQYYTGIYFLLLNNNWKTLTILNIHPL